MDEFIRNNRVAWDRRATKRDWYVDTAVDEDFLNPLRWADPVGWLDRGVAGKKVLCLAAGGGRHGPLFAAAGAQVTVFDLSREMLALDRRVAAERGLEIRLVCDSMTNLDRHQLPPFDIVFMPVSTCYLPKLDLLFKQVASVTVLRGQFISFHKQPGSMQSSGKPNENGHYSVLYPNLPGLPLPPEAADCGYREYGTSEFLHTLEGIIGGICRAGFVVEDLVEPQHGNPEARPGSFRHRSRFLPPFFGVKARLINRREAGKTGLVWT